MKHLAHRIGTDLDWVQTRALKREYELRADGEVAATLRFRSSCSSLATAESADGCWTFKRVGFWQNRMTVRACGSEAEIATKHRSTLELSDGRRYRAGGNVWLSRYLIQSETGEPLIRYRKHGMMRLAAYMEITPAAAELAELPWMAMLGWYVVAMIHSDAAAAASIATFG
ncbi:MAG: hypothetical protein ACJ759_22610 [Thermoanaerobaculia bacterium]